MQHFIMLISLVVCLGQGKDEQEDEWFYYKKDFQKFYANPLEDEVRREVFFRNKMFVDQHNEKYLAGEAPFLMSLNKYSDMSERELKHFRELGRQVKEKGYQRSEKQEDSETNQNIYSDLNFKSNLDLNSDYGYL